MSLQEQAEKVLKDYELERKLSVFGETHIVGNAALKTTIKPDIDIQIYVDSTDFENKADKIKKMLINEGLEDIKGHRLAQSDKFLIKSNLCINDTLWTIDISLTEPSDNYLKDAYKFYLDFYDKIDQEKRLTIEKLKIHFLKQNKLKHSMAYYIYRAVIDESAKTPDEVLDYKARQEND